MHDASDRRQIRAAEKAAKLVDQNRREVLVALSGTIPGRAWLWQKLGDAHVFESTFNDDPGRMAFLEGQRSSGLQLLADWMQAAPEQFIQAMREANGRRTESDARDDAERAAGEHDRSEEPGRVDQGPASRTDDDGADVRAAIEDIDAIYRTQAGNQERRGRA